MKYRNIKELIKPLTKSDPDLHEALKRLDETADKIVTFLNNPEFPNLIVGDLTFTGDRSSVLPVVSSRSHTARVYRSTDQNIPDSVVTAVIFSDVRFDTDYMFDIAFPTRLTARTSGIYSIGGSILFSPNAAQARDVRLTVNGTTVIALNQVGANPSVGFPTGLVINTIFKLAQNDYVELGVFQNAGGLGLLLTATQAFSPEFWMHKLS